MAKRDWLISVEGGDSDSDGKKDVVFSAEITTPVGVIPLRSPPIAIPLERVAETAMHFVSAGVTAGLGGSLPALSGLLAKLPR